MSSQAPGVIYVGILVADACASPMQRLPGPGEWALVDDLPLQAGGCAANAGAAPARLGVRAAAVGEVGDDAFAGFTRRDLSGEGMGVPSIRVSPAPTSRTVTVIGEDRRYIHCVGANADLGPDDVDLSLVARARVLYAGASRLLSGLGPDLLAELFRWLTIESQRVQSLPAPGR